MNEQIIYKLSLIVDNLEEESLEDLATISYSMDKNQEESVNLDDIDSICLRYLLTYRFDENVEKENTNINLLSEKELIDKIRDLIKIMHEKNYFLDNLKKVAHESPEEDIINYCLKFISVTSIKNILNSKTNNWSLDDIVFNLDDYTLCEMLYIQFKLDNPDLSIREYEKFDSYHSSLVDNVLGTYSNPPKDISSLMKTNNKKLIRTLKTNLGCHELNDDEIAHLALCNSLLSILN